MSTPRTSPEVCGMGHSMKRKEDPRFIRGKGNYVDDIQLPGMLHMDIVRSPYAHARIKSINAERALKIPGVLAVITGETLAKYNLHWMPTLMSDTQMVLPTEKVMYQAQEVAAVIATDRYVAADGVEAVEVSQHIDQRLGGTCDHALARHQRRVVRFSQPLRKPDNLFQADLTRSDCECRRTLDNKGVIGWTVVSSLHAAHRIHQLVGIKDVGHNNLGAPALEKIAAHVTYADHGAYRPTVGQQLCDYCATGSASGARDQNFWFNHGKRIGVAFPLPVR